MGKTAICMQMLQLLNTGRIYKVSQLADLLDTNTRNIIEYKKELEDAGYYITSISGKYGGYQLEKSTIFPSIRLTNDEKNALVESYNFILSKKDFMPKDIYQKSMSKVLSSINIEEVTTDSTLLSSNKYQLTMLDEDIQKRYNFIQDAIKAKRVIKITYNSIKNGLATHVLHPYKLFIYNNSWFFLAWNPEAGDVWYFKVNRIEDYELLDEKFKVWKYFNPNDYIDNFGLTNNGDFYHIELIVNRKRAMLMKERYYGKNQKLEKISDDKYKVSLDMQNKEYILQFILGCGNDVKVISPDWLKGDLIKVAKQLLLNYRK